MSLVSGSSLMSHNCCRLSVFKCFIYLLLRVPMGLVFVALSLRVPLFYLSQARETQLEQKVQAVTATLDEKETKCKSLEEEKHTEQKQRREAEAQVQTVQQEKTEMEQRLQERQQEAKKQAKQHKQLTAAKEKMEKELSTRKEAEAESKKRQEKQKVEMAQVQKDLEARRTDIVVLSATLSETQQVRGAGIARDQSGRAAQRAAWRNGRLHTSPNYITFPTVCVCVLYRRRRPRKASLWSSFSSTRSVLACSVRSTFGYGLSSVGTYARGPGLVIIILSTICP